jgi:8-oxo-dGTP diphosphatase
MEVQVEVCGLILKENEILILKRASSKEFAKISSWTFPGGRVKHYKVPGDAVLREIKEETGLDVEIFRPIKV